MKIYISTGYRIGVFICSLIPLIISLVVLIKCIISGTFNFGDKFTLFTLGLGLELIILLDCITNRSLLRYVVVDDESYISYSFFHKKLCELYLDYSVYYRIFAVNAEFTWGKYIILSNYKFECDGRLFIPLINCKKILVMPYNDKTKSFLKLDEWIKI